MNDNQIIISLEDISFSYSKQNVLNHLSVNFYEGERVAILGANGSGKSTLMKLISGLYAQQSGQILLYGNEVGEEVEQLRAHCGIIFQNPDEQFVGSTVIDDLAFGLENRQIEREKMKKMIEDIAQQFDLMEYLHFDPTRLSGGQKQRVAIASVAILNPDVIIFDESTSMLDPTHRTQFFQTVEFLRETNPKQTQIMITHDLNEVIYFDRIIVLGNGAIAFDGTLDEFLVKDVAFLSEFGLELPYALEIAQKLSRTPSEIKMHYFEILKRVVVQ